MQMGVWYPETYRPWKFLQRWKAQVSVALVALRWRSTVHILVDRQILAPRQMAICCGSHA